MQKRSGIGSSPFKSCRDFKGELPRTMPRGLADSRLAASIDESPILDQLAAQSNDLLRAKEPHSIDSHLQAASHDVSQNGDDRNAP